ncbi:MAG: hypothetical protein R3D63_04920 [Paracoccaceae bacterium]
MFTRILTQLQLRRSTAFLLARADDRLLDDIGLSRRDLEAMHLGLGPMPTQARAQALPSGRTLPVAS